MKKAHSKCKQEKEWYLLEAAERCLSSERRVHTRTQVRDLHSKGKDAQQRVTPVCTTRTHAHSCRRTEAPSVRWKRTYRALRAEQTGSSRAAAGKVLLSCSSWAPPPPPRQQQSTQPTAAPCCAASLATRQRNRRSAHNPADHGCL